MYILSGVVVKGYCYFWLLLVGIVSTKNLVVVTGQQYTGCIDTTLSTEENVVTIGTPTVVCFQIGNTASSWASGVQYMRLNFNPSGDQYSKFEITNSYRDLILRSNITQSVFSNRDITVGAASQNALSFLRVYYNVTTKRIYPFLTAIMNVNKGKITSITWDNACVFCGGFADRCEENTYNYNGIQQTQDSSGQPTKSCYLTKQNCDDNLRTEPNSTLCDLTFYTVWSGTDSKGTALQSQAYRFSVFPPQQISDRITQLIPTFGLTSSDIIPNVTKITNDLSNSIFGNSSSTITNTTNTTGTTRRRQLLESILEEAKRYTIVTKIFGADTTTTTTEATITSTGPKEL